MLKQVAKYGKSKKYGHFIDDGSDKNKKIHGYFIQINGKNIHEKPITFTSAMLNYCRLGTMRKPRTKIKNGKKTKFFQDFSTVKVVKNFDRALV